MGEKLTPKQAEILRCLANHDWQRNGCQTARDVSEACGHRTRTWAADGLLALERRGLAEMAGVALWSGNARTWRITDAGRAALAARGGER